MSLFCHFFHFIRPFSAERTDDMDATYEEPHLMAVSFGLNHSWCATFLLILLLYWLFYCTNMFVIFVRHMYTLLPLPSLPLFPKLPLQVVRFPGTWVPWLNILHLGTNLKHIKCTSCYNVLWANPPLCCSERKWGREVVDGCRVGGTPAWGRDILFVDILTFLRCLCTRNHE